MSNRIVYSLASNDPKANKSLLKNSPKRNKMKRKKRKKNKRKKQWILWLWEMLLQENSVAHSVKHLIILRNMKWLLKGLSFKWVIPRWILKLKKIIIEEIWLCWGIQIRIKSIGVVLKMSLEEENYSILLEWSIFISSFIFYIISIFKFKLSCKAPRTIFSSSQLQPSNILFFECIL